MNTNFIYFIALSAMVALNTSCRTSKKPIQVVAAHTSIGLVSVDSSVKSKAEKRIAETRSMTIEEEITEITGIPSANMHKTQVKRMKRYLYATTNKQQEQEQTLYSLKKTDTLCMQYDQKRLNKSGSKIRESIMNVKWILGMVLAISLTGIIIYRLHPYLIKKMRYSC